MAEPPTIEFTEEGKTWHRVWRSAAIVKGSTGVQYKSALPISRSLPPDKRDGEVVNRYGMRVREHSDGTHSTMEGDRIVPDGESMRRHCEQAGYVHEPR